MNPNHPTAPSNAIPLRKSVLGALWGALVGDALGVPVEFRNRIDLQADPVTDLRAYGTHRQPKGTWSDDGALILCTVDSLLHFDFDTQDMGARFVRWMDDALWTATGEVFDMGFTTANALARIKEGIPAEQAGGTSVDSNGNGSLMRILPVALRFADCPVDSCARHIERASAITHGHLRSIGACVFYSLIIRNLLEGQVPLLALESARSAFTGSHERSTEFAHFRHILQDDFQSLASGEVLSTGYVLHTLRAALWCWLNTDNYKDCVLKAVNLGGDTDTTACVAGGLAGALYGLSGVPLDWRNQMQRPEDLAEMFEKFASICVDDKKKLAQ